MATARSPTSTLSESPSGSGIRVPTSDGSTCRTARSELGSVPRTSAGRRAAVVEAHAHLRGVADDVGVGDDRAVGVDHEAGARARAGADLHDALLDGRVDLVDLVVGDAPARDRRQRLGPGRLVVPAEHGDAGDAGRRTAAQAATTAARRARRVLEPPDGGSAPGGGDCSSRRRGGVGVDSQA